jgi:4-hydroxy-3-methylbut-2-enyl diphosphate reductase
VNRSVQRHQLRATGAEPGELVVGPFVHPELGPVAGPAGPLVAGELRREGRRVREQPIALHTGDAVADSVLFAVTYIDRAGGAVGFAVCAHQDDQDATAAAAAAVDTWRAVLRTRRLLLAAADPLCRGARRAQRILGGHARTHGPLVVLGSEEPPGTYPPGTITAATVADVPARATVVIPPYGVADGVRAELAARGVDVVDTTCPVVHRTQRTVRRFAADGDAVVVLGAGSRQAMTALTGQAPAAAVAVESPADVVRLRADPRRVSYVVAGGTPIAEANHLADALRARYPRIRAAHPDGLCYAAEDRLETLRSVLAASDVVLVQGRLPDGISDGVPVHEITGAGDIRSEWLAAAGTIGLVSTVAPLGPGHEIAHALTGLGPLSMVRRQVTTEIVEH